MLAVIAAAALAGCVDEPSDGQERAGIEAYRGCQLKFPDGSPDPCENDAAPAPIQSGAPGAPWTCIGGGNGVHFYWHPTDDRHAFVVRIDPDLEPNGTVFILESDGSRTLWATETNDHDYWFVVDEEVGDSARWSGLIYSAEVITLHDRLRDAEMERLWSDVAAPFKQWDDAWLDLRFTTPEGIVYTFDANREHPLIPGTWSPSSFGLEIDNETVLQYRHQIIYGGAQDSEVPARQPRCNPAGLLPDPAG